jgi:hypothetical protein
MPFDDAYIQNTIAEFNAGKYKSIRAAADASGIPRSTLQDRMRGSTNSTAAHEFQQRLTQLQEEFLVDWILEEDRRFCPPTHPRLREMANRILRMNGDPTPVGRHWVSSFLRRNPRVGSILARKLDAARAQASTAEQIRAFLERFEATRIELGIRMEDIYNMDETGLALGVCTNTRVLASSSKRKAYIKTPENHEWVSIIETISATGRKLSPVIVFKGQHLQTTWFPSTEVPEWYYTTSMNGWTSNCIGLHWLEKVFIPETDPSSMRHRLLILDGHGSHVDLEFQYKAKMSRVEILYLPPHASHVLQPLDLSCFSVIKSAYRRQIYELSSLDDGAAVKKERFIQYYKRARDEGLSERYIRAGWKAAGLCPFNIGHVLNSSQVQGLQKDVTTPPRRYDNTQLQDTIYTTPRRPQDVRDAQVSLQQRESLSRDVRTVLGKAGKAIGRANTHIAQLEADFLRVKHQLELVTPQNKRKRITIDPQERFADVVRIRELQLRAGQETTQRPQQQQPQRQQGPTARIDRSVGHPNFDEMCYSFQI